MDLLDNLLDLSIQEDIGPRDITTDNIIDKYMQGSGYIIAKQDIVAAGISVAKKVFSTFDPDAVYSFEVCDGDKVPFGQKILQISGNLRALLKGERIALNFLQRLSGIATFVQEYVTLLDGKKVKLVDTRKTTPGWRALEKHAVRAGGAYNHRFGLYDGVLIKDNHIAVSGGIQKAVNKIRDSVSHLVKIEVETSSISEVKEALDAGADIIMLDNMDIDMVKIAVKLINKRAVSEVSGMVTKKNIRAYADTGVDIISVGALTHSAVAVDLSMKINNV